MDRSSKNNCRISINGISRDTEIRNIKDEFSAYGPIVNFKISSGHVHIEYASYY